jgi:hypothetical protein
VRDVCRHCNNELLSDLDRYVAELCRTYFSIPVTEPIDILFEYRYELLLRWLLKAFYNAARARAGGAQLASLRKSVPYIVGKEASPCFRTSMLVGVTVAAVASAAERKFGIPEVLSPLVHKFGDLHFGETRVKNRGLR